MDTNEVEPNWIEKKESQSREGIMINIFKAAFSPDVFFQNLKKSEIHWVQAMSIFLVYVWFVLAFRINWDSVNLRALSILVIVGPVVYFSFALIAWLSFGKSARPLHLVGWMHAPLLLITFSWIIIKGVGWFISLFPVWLIEGLKEQLAVMFFSAPGPVVPPLLPLLILVLPTIWPLWVLYYGVKELRPDRMKVYWVWTIIYVIWGLNIYRIVI